MLAMTVVLEGAILGFIILDNFEQENAFDYSDLRRFQRFRDHAVNAFAKARYLREIELQKQLITDAKQVIEAKNKDITDSILYAKRIQEALLPGEAAIQKALPQSFVLYLPKDIVSGDFYWFASVGGKHIVVVADCTGHGVPGAFMSVMGNTVLNMLVNERGITEPDKILTELNREVKGNLFRYDPQARSNDGMEVAIVAIEPQAKKFTFAGANRPLFYVHFGEMNVIKGDPAPIGGGPMATEAPFTALEFPITAGDMLFLASDGYQDQFGGPDFRKFKIKAMRELMHAIHAVPPDQQRGILHKAHTDWRGYHEQTDDILIIGIKFA
jgi:serine phosphatase RsbU (regulator of sigma subunit)